MCVMVARPTQRVRSASGNFAHCFARSRGALFSLLMHASEPRPPAPAVASAPWQVGWTSKVVTWFAAATKVNGAASSMADRDGNIALLLDAPHPQRVPRDWVAACARIGRVRRAAGLMFPICSRVAAVLIRSRVAARLQA